MAHSWIRKTATDHFGPANEAERRPLILQRPELLELLDLNGRAGRDLSTEGQAWGCSAGDQREPTDDLLNAISWYGSCGEV